MGGKNINPEAASNLSFVLKTKHKRRNDGFSFKEENQLNSNSLGGKKKAEVIAA